MHKYFFLLFLLFITFSAFAQQNGEISGRILDAESDIPLMLANVYLADTFFGSSTDSSGNFVIYDVPPGNYTLVVSYIGYEAYTIGISVTQRSLIFQTIRLHMKVFQSDEVVVSAETPNEWRRNLKFFTREFLGQSENADHCTILNPEVLSFTGSIESNHLEASAEDVLKVENSALGYQLNLVLAEYIYHRGMIRYKVYPQYQPMTRENDADTEEWEKNRKKTYNGSLKHFLQGLIKGQTEPEGFIVTQTNALPPEDALNYSLPVDSLLRSRDNEYEITFDDVIKIVYKHKMIDLGRGPLDKTQPARIVNRDQRQMATWLIIKRSPVLFDHFGYLHDPFRLMMYGDWAMLRIADALPRNYIPKLY